MPHPAHRPLARLSCCLAVLLLGSSASVAAPLSKDLLPNTTRGYVAVENLPALVESWRQTQLGRLFADPVMEPFLDHLHGQLSQRVAEAGDRLGIAVADLEGLSSGEFSLALVAAPDGEPGVVMLVDITGHEERAEELLKKVAANLAGKGATRSEQKIDETTVTIYDIPLPGESGQRRQAVYCRKSGILCLTDHLEVTKGILARFSGDRDDTLAGHPPFVSVMERCGSDPNLPAAQIRVFVEPLPLAEAVREMRHLQRASGPDILKVLRNQGFGAVQAIGGAVTLSVGRYGSLYRVAVHAPGPYEKAMRMVKLPSGGDFAPQSWVPRDVVSYRSFRWDMQGAFDNFGSLFDELFGEGEEGVWEDVLESVRTDPNGPGVDIRDDLIAYLGQRATIITDIKIPVTPNGRRRLFAAELTDAETMARSIEKSMANDPTVKQRQLHGHTVYEIIAEPEPVEIETGLPTLAIEHPDAAAPGAGAMPGGGLPNSAVAVAHGQLLISSHIDLLEKVLGEQEEREWLARDVDFGLIMAELNKLGKSDPCYVSFIRNDEQLRMAYELFRQGKLPGAEIPLAQALDALLAEGIDGEPRKPKFDGSKLPDFQVVRRYLGPAGSYAVNNADGWYIVGFTLNKEAPLAAKPDAAARPQADVHKE